MKKIFFVLIAVFPLLLCSCEHKQLDQIDTYVSLSYDWSKVNGEKPASMDFYLLPGAAGEKVLRYVTRDADTTIYVSNGDYTAVSFSSNRKCVELREDSNPKGYLLYSDTATDIGGIKISEIDRPEGTESQKVVEPAERICSCHDKTVIDDYKSPSCTMVLKPSLNTSKVTVNATEIENLSTVAQCVGILTGFNGGFYPVTENYMEEPCTLPFELEEVDERTMVSSFETFRDNTGCGKNWMVLYIISAKDGSKYKYTTNVTDQVEACAGKDEIVINIKGLGIPISGESGFHPSVNGWIELNEQIINL